MHPSTSTAATNTAKETVPAMSVPSSSRIPSNISIRTAQESDIEALSICFYNSFWPSHPFWIYEFGPDKFYTWFVEAFRMGIVDDPSMVTYVAVDTAVKPDTSVENKALRPWEQKGANVSDGRIVAFTRWRVPQQDGNLEERWPDVPEGVDMEVMGAFFGGMEVNHHELMSKRPHWFLQLLGTETGYQGKGIGRCFVDWGCQKADEQELECYVDASPLGAPVYKGAGFVWGRSIEIPEKDTYGHFDYQSYVRPKQS